MKKSLELLNQEVCACRKCLRLVRYREHVVRTRRRAFLEWEYWGKPVPGFGDPCAKLLIIGLAPAAHGANRTGRMFTGDRSGDFLYRALHRASFANKATSLHRADGLKLRNAYITAAVRCPPPENMPTPTEIQNCRPYLITEMDLIQPKAVLVLGGIALKTYLQLLKDRGLISALAQFPFRHGAIYKFPADLPRVFCCYHPSQQNTFTGRLTDAMLLRVLRKIRNYIRS